MDGLLIALPAASLTRAWWFSTSSLLTWAAGKNLNANLAQVHKLSIQSANDGWIMDERRNKAWHEFYIPDPAGNEIKWVLNITLTTARAHKSLFCANLHASRFHESQIKFPCSSSDVVEQQEKEFVWILSADYSLLLSPLCDGLGSLSRPVLATVGHSCLMRPPCGAMHETGQGQGKENLI